MKYMLLIHQGSTPLPGSADWDALSDEEKQGVFRDYGRLNETPGVTSGQQMEPPEMATTVRVQDGRTLTTDGPFAEIKEQLAGFYLVECDTVERATEIVTQIPEAAFSIVEIRPVRDLSAVG